MTASPPPSGTCRSCGATRRTCEYVAGLRGRGCCPTCAHPDADLDDTTDP
jgi:hypothetical protein